MPQNAPLSATPQSDGPTTDAGVTGTPAAEVPTPRTEPTFTEMAPPPAPQPAFATMARPPVPQPLMYPPVPDLTDVEQRIWGAVAHGAGLISFWPALTARMVTRGRGQFGQAHATEALNFQITYLLSLFLCSVLTFVFIGFLLLPLVTIPALIFSIKGTIAASKGQAYRYPINIRFISS